MGASLFMQQRINLTPSDSKFIGDIWDSISYALGSGIGWLLAIVGLAAIREKNGIFRCSCSFERIGHHIYHCRPDGNGFYVFLWFEHLIKKGINNGYEFYFSKHWSIPCDYSCAGSYPAGS